MGHPDFEQIGHDSRHLLAQAHWRFSVINGAVCRARTLIRDTAIDLQRDGVRRSSDTTLVIQQTDRLFRLRQWLPLTLYVEVIYATHQDGQEERASINRAGLEFSPAGIIAQGTYTGDEAARVQDMDPEQAERYHGFFTVPIAQALQAMHGDLRVAARQPA